MTAAQSVTRYTSTASMVCPGRSVAGNVEADGLVVSRVRHGTTVAPQRPTLPRAEVDRRLTEAARAYATLARQLGVTTEEAESAVRGQLRDSY